MMFGFIGSNFLNSQSHRRYDRLRREELRDEKIDSDHLTRFGTLTAEQQ